MNVKVKMNKTALKKLSNAQIVALEMTAEAVKTDVIASNVIPFGHADPDTGYSGGTLQNESTSVDIRISRRGKVSVSSDTPYARRMYFHPEYKFNQLDNPNAKGRWYDDWISGSKKNFAPNAYKKLYKKLSGV